MTHEPAYTSHGRRRPWYRSGYLSAGELLIICILAGVAGWLLYTLYTASQTITVLETQVSNLTVERTNLASELQAASTTIAAISTELNLTAEELEDVTDDYKRERERNEEFEEEYRETIETVQDLNKLAQIDEELLQQYSRVYFLSENYVPRRLREIDREWLATGRTDEYVLYDMWPFLEDLLEDAERDDIELRIVSAYRSFDEQAQLKGRYLQTYGEGANTFSADQGYSEHQLGTAVDFSTPDLNGTIETFGTTEAYEWLLDNAHKHGFILSYPEGNAFYVYEPWHWRFVGEELARDLHRDDRRFYEVPQRELDEYRLELFD